MFKYWGRRDPFFGPFLLLPIVCYPKAAAHVAVRPSVQDTVKPYNNNYNNNEAGIRFVAACICTYCMLVVVKR